MQLQIYDKTTPKLPRPHGRTTHVAEQGLRWNRKLCAWDLCAVGSSHIRYRLLDDDKLSHWPGSSVQIFSMVTQSSSAQSWIILARMKTETSSCLAGCGSKKLWP